MSDPLSPTTSYSFETTILEWVLNVSIPTVKGVANNILLKRVWVTYDKLKDLEDTYGSLTSAHVLDMMEDAVAGGSYVRAILPSEVGDYMRAEATAEDILSRYKDSGGLSKPITGYYFYVDSSITESFINYELMAKCISSIQSIHKSHVGGFNINNKYKSTPVNTSVYSTYPVRLVVGEKQVVGCKAGDMLRYSRSGWSGEYTVQLNDPDSLLQEYDGSIRVIKNQTGTATVKIYDSNDMGAPFSEISITVERVE